MAARKKIPRKDPGDWKPTHETEVLLEVIVSEIEKDDFSLTLRRVDGELTHEFATRIGRGMLRELRRGGHSIKKELIEA